MAALLCQATHTAKLRTLPPQLLYSFQYRDTPTIKAPPASYVPANTSTVCKLVARVFFLPICVCVCLPRKVVAGAIVAPLWKRSSKTSPFFAPSGTLVFSEILQALSVFG